MGLARVASVKFDWAQWQVSMCACMCVYVYVWVCVCACMCACVCVLLEGYPLAKAFGSWTSFGSTTQCVVTIIAFMAGVVGTSVDAGFPQLPSTQLPRLVGKLTPISLLGTSASSVCFYESSVLSILVTPASVGCA